MVLNSVFGLTKEYVWALFPVAGYCIGAFLDHKETLRMTRFRDKSALYGRQLAPGEKPSWP
ncbi:NADH dehydrogenase [ubiquinone] 1 beta subcomplex subunit 1 [Lutzomyia longipalpis]|uniref:NADH dehydrogenase [ubiquinone] 1 beta subcomplex subunit 1 n=1 Tax=Lutzomyia longipalpis TaxID=7200 RepID=UPI002483B8E0|nr:NADH dehydrogenase [ubiquinone] 1 beta subcomplex subunit 1 [Lutzomyia longipalpis]